MPARNPKKEERSYGAAKPTMDELLENGAEANRVSANFLKVDLETGLTFSGIALRTNDPIKKRRNVRSARKAYDTVMRMIEKVHLTDGDAKILGGNLLRLRAELEGMGEDF